MHECGIIVFLLLHERVYRSAPSAVLYRLMLHYYSLITARLEGLVLVSVVLVTDGEGLSVFNLAAELVSSEAGHIRLEYFTL